MFVNLTEDEKEEKFKELLDFADKINNICLKNVCKNILKDYKKELFVRSAGHDGIKNVKENRTHQCFDGGLIHHILNVTKNAYNIATIYRDKIEMDLILFPKLFRPLCNMTLH